MAVGAELLPLGEQCSCDLKKSTSDVKLQLLAFAAQMISALVFFFPWGKWIYWNCTVNHLFLQKGKFCPVELWQICMGCSAHITIITVFSKGSLMLHVSRWVMPFDDVNGHQESFQGLHSIELFSSPSHKFLSFKIGLLQQKKNHGCKHWDMKYWLESWGSWFRQVQGCLGVMINKENISSWPDKPGCNEMYLNWCT